MSASVVLRILFYYSGVISLMLGGFILYLAPKKALNRIFFTLCVSLTFWAVGFSLAINAPNMETCLLWRRVSAVGWGSLFAVLLHFALVFSNKEALLKKWWLYLLLYAPATIIVYVFAVSGTMAAHLYQFVETAAGWTNVANSSVWDWVFNIYYVAYMMCSLILIWLHGRHAASRRIKKQADAIVYSFLAAFIIGSVSDIFGKTIFSSNIPQIAPIIILVPIVFIHYSIIQHGLMTSEPFNQAELILTKSTQGKVYQFLSIALILGSVLSFVLQLSDSENIFRTLLSSCSILIFGIVIYVIRIMKVRNYVKDIVLIGIIFVTIPGIILLFADFGSVTVWAVSFLFIVISMVFNKPVVLLSISVSILSTQVLIWMLTQESTVVIGSANYIGRLAILCFTIVIAYYINKIYINRLKQNADQLRLQKFISEISSDFINVNASNIDEKMNWVIRIVGKLFAIDSISILLVDTERYTVDGTNIWNVNKMQIGTSFSYTFTQTDMDWLFNHLSTNEPIYIPDVSLLPETVIGIRNKLQAENTRALIAIPIEEKTNAIRIMQCNTGSNSQVWVDDELRVLKIIANIFNDALLKIEAEKEISFMAYHDHLTGLPNRRLFRDRLNQAIALAKRTEKLLGVIFIDLDSFKTINDTIGHEGGDSLLRTVSDKLVKSVRLSDTVSRFGGDEFLILINNIARDEDIVFIAEKIMEVLKQPFSLDGQEYNLTTSVGISMYPFDGNDMDSLIRNADIAMYKAKENGKNQFVICTTALKNEVLRKIKITNSLYRALDRDELYLNFQPQVSLTTGEIIGVEALIRWRHPELGLVSPAVFIPIAEQIGVIGDIGEWVLEAACRQAKAWQDAGLNPGTIAVNVSAYQLRNQNFTENLHKILKKTGLDPAFLEIEITESAAMNETNNVLGLMNCLRSLGILIAIDDFGTDYSSLSRLKELPIDKIKIDKQFVDGIEDSEKDQAIVRTIINLAKNLDLKVIAEGVENAAQLAFLKEEQCDDVQGYFFHKPMSAEDIENNLR
ncbi:EAL domain-containing protein [Oscillospiraceae bacterium WX1]